MTNTNEEQRGCWIYDSESSYGPFPEGHDPRAFGLDPQMSTAAQRDAHAEACKEWDEGGRTRYPKGAFGIGSVHEKPRRWDPDFIFPF